MQQLESPFVILKRLVNVKIPFSMLCTSKIHPFLTWKLLGNLIEIRVTSVEWTLLGLVWPHNTIFVNLGLFGHFETFRNTRPCYSHINVGDYYEI